MRFRPAFAARRCRFEQLESRRLLTSAPSFPDQTLDVDENRPAGTEVGVLSVEHEGPVEFEITSGTGRHLFQVDNSGVITVQAPANLDHEAVSQYELNIVARDPNLLEAEDSAVVTIRINDVAEAPVVLSPIGVEPLLGSVQFEIWIPETTFFEADEGDRFTLSLRQDGGPPPSWIEFDPTTNILRGLPPNLEGEINLEIVATDSTGLTGVDVLTLDVLENPFPWQNFINNLDVNNDNDVTPRDIALLVQDLLRNNIHSLPLSGPTDPPAYLDVFADNQVTPRDVAILAAELIRQTRGQGEAEGESFDRLSPDLPPPLDGESLAAWYAAETTFPRQRRSG